MFLTTTFKLSNLGRDFPIKIGNNHVKRVHQSKVTNTEYNVVLDHVPKTEYYNL